MSHQAHFNLISLEIVEAIHPLPSRSSGLIPRCSQARRETLSLRVLGMPLGFLLVGCAWKTLPWLGCLTRRQPNQMTELLNLPLKESPDTPEDKTYFFRLYLRSRSFETQSWRLIGIVLSEDDAPSTLSIS